MITCEHSNEGADLDRWRNITESVRGKALEANIKLYKEFEQGLELLLRRQVPSVELSGVIHAILAAVMKAIESDGLPSPDLLPALVRRTARQLIPMTVPRIETDASVTPNVMLESILQRLPPNQREALEMVYVGGADDQVVCGLKGLTIKELTTIKTSVREQFMVISTREAGSKAMSASSEIC
jgi:hypothetical protein